MQLCVLGWSCTNGIYPATVKLMQLCVLGWSCANGIYPATVKLMQFCMVLVVCWAHITLKGDLYSDHYSSLVFVW